MKSTFKVLFYLKKGSEKKNGEVMIMARITIDGKLCQFSTKQSILPENWNIAAGKAKGKDAGKINALLEDIKASLNNIYHEQQRRDNYVTAEKVKNEFLGHSEKHETILNLFKKHNDDVKQLVGISKTIATYRKYEVTRRHLAEFIQSKYNISDIAINEITPMFITDFELYLRTTCKCGYNTTAKFLQFFKRIILIARNNGILIGDPFANYKIRLEKVDRGYLSEDEIKIILKKKMVSERLENVIGQLGTLDEVLALCRVDRRITPCIDFGHLNARTLGGIASKADYVAILDRMEEALGDARARQFQVHFSRIEYTAGGEKRHWTFAETQFGPEPQPLMELLAERRLEPVIICESAGTQAEDARTMAEMYGGANPLRQR